MGRPELPLDPARGPIEAFACDLRALREQSGGPSYRALARRTHFSVTTLSQAAAGRALPTLPVLIAFVAACSGDVAAWEARWRALAADLTGTAEPEQEAHVPVSAAQPGLARLLWGSRPARIRTMVIAVLALAGTTAALTLPGSPAPRVALGPASPSPTHLSGTADPIADYSDPARAGCGPDALTLASTPVTFQGRTAGLLELRYSPHCGAAWSRFTPQPNLSHGAGVYVTIWAIRPADGGKDHYTVRIGTSAMFGNILLTARGCVLAQVSVRQGSVRSPFTVTPCLAGPAA